jgi:hypothetical protein
MRVYQRLPGSTSVYQGLSASTRVYQDLSGYTRVRVKHTHTEGTSRDEGEGGTHAHTEGTSQDEGEGGTHTHTQRAHLGMRVRAKTHVHKLRTW